MYRHAFLLLAALGLLMPSAPACAQGLGVTPVNIVMAPGQSATTLTITNQNQRKISFQIRGFSWSQDSNGDDVLDPADGLVASPPLATIQPGGSQVVRLVLRAPPKGREATYRVLVDQLPPPHEVGVVHVLVRMSIPIFAQPETRIAPRVKWRIVNEGDRSWLVATNEGTRHLTVQKMELHAPGGRTLQLEIKSPPHILAGATRRWPVVTNGALSPHEQFRLVGTADSGTIDEQMGVGVGP